MTEPVIGFFSSVYRHVECNISVSCKANAVVNQFGALRYSDLKVQ